MKKKILLIALAIVTLASCKQQNSLNVNVTKIESNCKITRIDSLFYASNTNLNELREKYPEFFSENLSDSVLISRRNDPKLKDMAAATLEKFSDIKEIKKELDDVFKHAKYYYSDFKTPDIYFFISDWQFTQPVSFVAENNSIYIALNLYLSYESAFYSGVYDYWRMRMEDSFIPVDVAYVLANYFVPYNAADTKLIELMVYNGKLLYMTKAFVPGASAELIFHYTEDQLKWAEANQEGLWSYFISNEILYKSDRNFAPRFFEAAPFTKFYLEIDNQSPPQLGSWIGYEIIKSFVENNKDVSLKEMLSMSGVEIFQKAGYKPSR